MKRWIALMLCMLVLAGCGGGDVSEVGRQIGACERYSGQEIARAMDDVEAYFKAEFEGCKLLRLSYDEDQTLEEARGWSEQYGAEAIVLVSDFYVSPTGGDGSLNQDETYRNWKWILIRSGSGWELKTWGYG